MHEKFMKRTFELALKGLGNVNPNPLVGAVVVKKDKIISEGYHCLYGGNHAEVNALKKMNGDLEGCVLYVNLEPCSHFGKTPPCVDLIIKSGISKVVVAMRDPNPLVSGRGIEKLRKANIQVVEGVLEKEAMLLNKFFIKNISEKIPYVIMKTAMTLDGKIATVTGKSKWISSSESRAYVHMLRHQMTGIMVGVGTVLHDDPKLDVRLDIDAPSNPTRIVLDRNCRTPLDCYLVKTSNEIPLIIGTTERADIKKKKALNEKGVKIIEIPETDGVLDLKFFLHELSNLGIDSILLEGGGTTNWLMVEQGLVDEVYTFVSPKLVGGSEAITPIEGKGIDEMQNAINLKNISYEQYGSDILIKGEIEC